MTRYLVLMLHVLFSFLASQMWLLRRLLPLMVAWCYDTATNSATQLLQLYNIIAISHTSDLT